MQDIEQLDRNASLGEQIMLRLRLLDGIDHAWLDAHLDPARRAALFGRLEGRGQVWMTATEAALFETIGSSASRFHVDSGAVFPG